MQRCQVKVINACPHHQIVVVAQLTVLKASKEIDGGIAVFRLINFETFAEFRERDSLGLQSNLCQLRCSFDILFQAA